MNRNAFTGRFVLTVLYFIATAGILRLNHAYAGDHSPQEYGRERWQNPERILDTLGVREGMVIGEVGAGDGYFTFKLANRIGSKGKVYANDINRRALSALRSRCEREGVENIEILQGGVTRTNFPAHTMDMVIMVYVFHELTEPIALMEDIKSSLKPGALVVIVDRDPDRYGREYGHFMRKEDIIERVLEADYELVDVKTFLPRDNIYILRLPELNSSGPSLIP